MGAKARRHLGSVGVVLAVFFITMTAMTAFFFAPRIDKSNIVESNIRTSNASSVPSVPVAVPADDNTILAAGGDYSLMIDESGQMWGWGNNASGQLGIGAGQAGGSQTPIKVGGAMKYKAVAAGTSHTLAIAIDDTLWAWGNNSNGQLGSGNTTNQNSPVQIGAGLGSPAGKFTAISAGDTHSLAIHENGSLYAWGNPANGRLGNSQTTGTYNSPVLIGSSTWIAINAGNDHSLGVQANGNLYAWGNPGTANQQNKLGNGTTQLLVPHLLWSQQMPQTIQVFLPPVPSRMVSEQLAVSNSCLEWEQAPTSETTQIQTHQLEYPEEHCQLLWQSKPFPPGIHIPLPLMVLATYTHGGKEEVVALETMPQQIGLHPFG